MKRPIPLFKVATLADVSKSLQATLDSGQLASGSKVVELEGLLQSWLNVSQVCCVSDVSGGITLALYAGGVRPGDEVVLSPMTCLATSIPVSNLFASPVWCDIDPSTGMLDPELLPKVITERTKAIIVYHWSGDVAPLEAIQAISRKSGIPVVEDASEALGAEYSGVKIGCQTADFTVFSFGPVRHLTCGEGAAISVTDKTQFRRLQALRRYGIDTGSFRLPNGDLNPDSDIPIAGYNFPMNNLSATLGVTQLPLLDEIVRKHRDNGNYYTTALAGTPGITLLNRTSNAVSGYWTYSMRVKKRNDLIHKLQQAGIGCQRLHVRNDRYTCFSKSRSSVDLPGVDLFDQENISIPCGWWVGPTEREYIVSCVQSGW